MKELLDVARKLNDAVNMIEGDDLGLSERVELTKLENEIFQISTQINKLRQWML